ncbi:uncharacterized protein [Atheta coriaria]|uniref:uncharacterized protein isoform X2 n=1 Tax=Dalotia coriaria TaxID=877792 RepID=UPI0031F35BA5
MYDITRISSVIIILIMMVRNVHTNSGTCKIAISDWSIQLRNKPNFLAVNSRNHKPDYNGTIKYPLCILHPKDITGYYIFDVDQEYFICIGKPKKFQNRSFGEAISRRNPMPNCLLEETVLNGYSFFHGANNLQLHVTRRNIVNTNEVMVLLKVPLPADRKNSCSEGLEKYCQKLHTGKVRNRKRHRKFINMFCEPSCWA